MEIKAEMGRPCASCGSKRITRRTPPESIGRVNTCEDCGFVWSPDASQADTRLHNDCDGGACCACAEDAALLKERDAALAAQAAQAALLREAIDKINHVCAAHDYDDAMKRAIYARAETLQLILSDAKAAFDAALAEAVARERERCAKIAEDNTPPAHSSFLVGHAVGSTIAAAIRETDHE